VDQAPPTPIRVVLAIGHAITRDGIRHLLELESDLRVIGDAANAREAFRLAEDLKPDLVILDGDLLSGGANMLRSARAQLGASNILLLNVDNPDRGLLTSGIVGALPRSASSADLLVAIRAGNDASGDGARMATVFQEAPTAREIQVLRLVEEGLKNKAIAQRLSTSERTVQFHLTNIFAKLSARSRTEAVHLARQQGWLD
jgi:DNA-binding NarL/FixJ family response regulator